MSSEGPVRDRQPTGYALIETMRREADGHVVRRARHLDRMQASAGTLGFPFERGRAEDLLDRLPRGEALRVRLELSPDGGLASATTPFRPLEDGATWRLAIAATRLDASDPLRRHKTDRRDLYAAARAEYPSDRIDEVLLLNGDGELAEGTITNLFVDRGDGRLLTPRLESGALPGILRAELLDGGQAVETRLGLDDLRRASAIFVGNSLRGLIAARLEIAP